MGINLFFYSLCLPLNFLQALMDLYKKILIKYLAGISKQKVNKYYIPYLYIVSIIT